MITLSQLYPIGYVAKTHGIKGELNIVLDTPHEPGDFRFLVFDMDATFVPFPIVSARGQGVANRLVSLDDVDTVDEAKKFVGKTAYVLRRELQQHDDNDNNDDNGLYLSDLVGFKVTDENGDPIGTVTGYNDDTQNFLFEVERPDGKKVYIPYVEDWVTMFDPDKRTIALLPPNGLIDN